MNMKQILCILLFSLSTTAFSQEWAFEKPDYKSIEKNIANSESFFFYETLMNKFKAADSTMTIDEKRHLYYGYSFNENYSPYGSPDYSDSLRTVIRLKEHGSAEYQKIVQFGDSVQITEPFNLRAINYQLYALEKLKRFEEFNNKITQLRIVVDALMSSGDGRSKKDAYYVIYTSHEYDLLNIMGYQFGGTQSLIEHYDYLTVAKNEDDIEGFYFDVSPCLNSMSNMLKN